MSKELDSPDESAVYMRFNVSFALTPISEIDMLIRGSENITKINIIQFQLEKHKKEI